MKKINEFIHLQVTKTISFHVATNEEVKNNMN